MSKTAEKIFVNTLMQGWIQDYLDNPHKIVSDDVQAILRRKYAQFEADTQKLLAPAQPKKPKASRKQDSKAQAETVSSEPIARYEPSGTVVPVPDGLQFKENAILKRSRGK